MPPRKGGRPPKKDEGLARTDNNLRNHSWPMVYPINQKNFYTDYLKRDDQALVWRQRAEIPRLEPSHKERAYVPYEAGDEREVMDIDPKDDVSKSEEIPGSRIIVIHPGSRNLRIGRASDALPKTVPNVIARQSPNAEWEEEDGPIPKRLKIDDELPDELDDIAGDLTPPRRTRGNSKKSSTTVEKESPQMNSSFQLLFNKMSNELKAQMRQNKRRVLPNSKEVVINHNKRYVPETIKEHNDPYRAEWTPISSDIWHFVGDEALHIADDSTPRFKLFWPLRDGVFNEHDYTSKRRWQEDVTTILRESLQKGFDIQIGDYESLSAVLVIPDLYDRIYVTEMLDLLLKEFRFAQVSLFQESVAATYGAGFSSACIVDIGAQKTSVSCVEEGMVVPDSRVNLKMGGDDVTNSFIRMLIADHFPYADINLLRRYDYLLAEELKIKYTSLNEADVAVQFNHFHVRAPGKETVKYGFKTYDEIYLAPFSLFAPQLLDDGKKISGRRSLWGRSYDIYDDIPNDPTSSAQIALCREFSSDDSAVFDESATQATANAKSSIQTFPANPDGTPRTSVAGSPVPEEAVEPGDAIATTSGNVIAGGSVNFTSASSGGIGSCDQGPLLTPLDSAITSSIYHATKEDEKRTKDFYSGILLVGGGSATTGLNHLLEERLAKLRPDLSNIIISSPPRELDPQVLVWKGASVFGKLTSTNDSWIKQSEYDVLNTRVLPYKTLWMW